MSSGTSSSGRSVADVLKLWTSIPTRALIKRYQRTANADKAHASAVCTAYKQCFALKVVTGDFDDDFLALPPSVRAMWREHILDTVAYAENCRSLCGRLLHHAPDASLDSELHNLRCNRTVQAYKKHFGDSPPAVWDFGELPALTSEEERGLAADAPAAKRAKTASAQMSVSVQAPFLPLRTISARADITVGQLFQAFVDASGSTHLVQGRSATPPTTRLRCGNEWLHELQTLAEAGVKEGGVVYVAVPQERHSRDQLAVSIKDGAVGETATVFVRACDSVHQLMRQAQDTLGVPADVQQLIFRGAVLEPTDTLAARAIADGSKVQMVVGRRREKDAQMSPGGTWRVA